MWKSKLRLTAVLFALTMSMPSFAQDPKPAHMPNMPHAGDAATVDAMGKGVVKAIDANSGTVTISHEPIAALSWPAMTMAFKVAQPDLLKGVAVGNKVEFALHGKDMSAVITSLKKTE